MTYQLNTINQNKKYTQISFLTDEQDYSTLARDIKKILLSLGYSSTIRNPSPVIATQTTCPYWGDIDPIYRIDFAAKSKQHLEHLNRDKFIAELHRLGYIDVKSGTR